MIDITAIKDKKNINVYINKKLVKYKDNYCYCYGNIYNYNKDDLINLYEKYGTSLFDKLNGEYFIIMVYKNKLICVRDRLGSKLLYYSNIDNKLIVSNSLNYFINNYKDKLTINKQTVANYLNYNYINEPLTIFNEVKKIESGCYLVNNKSYRYYDLIEEFKNNKNTTRDYNECEKVVEDSLIDATKLRIKGKKNIGIYFSSGVDSTLITSIVMKYKLDDQIVNTYTIGYKDSSKDESTHAEKFSKYLNTNHHTFYFTKEDVKNVVEKIVDIYSEPLSDYSIIPMTFLNSKVNDSDIILSGDGSDQMFCGSNLYHHKYFSFMYRLLKKDKTYTPYNPKLYYVKQFMGIEPEYYDKYRHLKYNKRLCYMLYDIKCFLSNRLLPKVSLPAMYYDNNIAHPFCDINVLDYSLKINQKYKYYKKEKKYIIKNVLYKYIDKEEFDATKKGFGIPLKEWLNDIFLSDIEKLSTKEFLEKQNIFKYDIVNTYINNLKNDLLNNNELYILFSYYIFQLWYSKYML
ncbi:MAG: hypothetical protein IJ574_02010 [Bacilli bacterium]|nr:hypothetical protein [Bacilli bacterium]